MRTFESGATRDDNIGKLDPLHALSWQVVDRYLEYLRQHGVQKDGSVRPLDNWKKGFPIESTMESLLRHCKDAARVFRGLPVPDNASLEDLLCAIKFNANSALFELLVAKSGNREERHE